MKWPLVLTLVFSLQVFAQMENVQSPSPQDLSATSLQAADSGGASGSQVAQNIQNLKESDIQVQLEAPKKPVENESPFLKVLFALAVLGILGYGSVVLARKYRYSNGKSPAMQINVLTQHYLGPKKSLAIVRVAGESILIGVTDHNISMIKSLSLLDEDVPEEIPKEFAPLLATKSKAQMIKEDGDSKDDFSMAGIKDFVSTRLKNMRTID